MAQPPSPGSRQPKPPGKLLKRLLSLTVRPPVEGFVDRVVAGEVHGWAFDPARPERRLLVVATLDGAVQAEALADLPRRDLEAAGKGDGKHGFRLRLPPSLANGAGTQVQIQVMIGAQRFPLKRGAVAVEPGAGRSAAPPEAEPSAVVGCIEVCNGKVVKGWAVNPNNPEAPALVDLFDGEVYLGSATANVDRPRLQKRGAAPQGAKGFVFPIPAGLSLSSGEHLRGRISGTRHELSKGPGLNGDDAEPDPWEESEVAKPASEELAAAPADGLDDVDAARSHVNLHLRAGGADDLGADEAASGTSLDLADASEAELRSRLLEADWVLLGGSPEPGWEAALVAAPPNADVLTWPTPDAPENGRLSLQLGLRPLMPLVARGLVLLSYPGPLADDLKAGGGPVSRWLTRQAGIRWCEVPAPLTRDAPVAQARTPDEEPPLAAQQITLAAWSGWREGPPAALLDVLAALERTEVEVLAPASDLAADWQDALQRATSAVVTLRQVDGAAEEAARRRDLLNAASGELILLFDGALRIDSPQLVLRALAWAGVTGVGCATASLGDGARVLGGWRASPDGSAIIAAPAGATAAPALALGVSPLLLAISRRALRAAWPGVETFGDDWDDMALLLELRRQGLAAVVLDGTAGVIEPGALEPWLQRPLSLALRTRYAPELLKARTSP